MRRTLAAALLITALSSSSWAQSPIATDQSAGSSQTQSTPPSGQPGTGQSTMSGRMMGDRGMGHWGMMNMMGDSGMGMRQSGCGLGALAMIDHIEGCIAFLRTELKITDAQSGAWNTFADALRSNAKNLGEVRASMMRVSGAGQSSLIDRVGLQEKWLGARLEGTRAIKSALTNLVGTFSDEQKKTADELLGAGPGMNAIRTAQPPRDGDRMGRMMGYDWDHRKPGRDWRMRRDEDEDRGYNDEDRPRRRVKICIEDENGDQYCRYRQ